MMDRDATLVLTAAMRDRLKQHLFPGDGEEAAAIALCGRGGFLRPKFLVRRLMPVPYRACERDADRITWPGAALEEAFEAAEREDLSIFLFHSHPGGLCEFSHLDDESDAEVMPAIFAALDESGRMHGSAVMTPDGAIRARYFGDQLQSRSVSLVSVVGQDLEYYFEDALSSPRRPLAFTSAMTEELGRLCACVVGVSGTGSIVVEQLVRLGFGEIILIDFDEVELKNLNRILNAGLAHATASAPKVDVAAEAAERHRVRITLRKVKDSIATRQAILEASDADNLFCCIDGLEGRNICDKIGAAYLVPVIDLGVTIPVAMPAGGTPRIADVLGRIDFVRPDGPSLGDRGVYTPALLREEYLRRAAPEIYKHELAAGYLDGLQEEAPSVISLNMRAAADSVMEFIARAFPFRHEPNENFSRTLFSLADGEPPERIGERDFRNSDKSALLAAGSREPLLGLPRFVKTLRARVHESA
jgi:hypothetical protein